MTSSVRKFLIIPGFGVVCALALLLGTEALLHTDGFLQKYRSVFAAGRAGDKAIFVQSQQPSLVFLGNSRVDNAISPKTIADTLGLPASAVFNFGIPGINTRALVGLSAYLGSTNTPQRVVIGLDETLFLLEDDLSYSVFFGDRTSMWGAGEYRAWFASILRLWGFSSSLKGLREPAKMLSFMQASLGDKNPWGGALEKNLGFRAKQGHIAATTSSFTYHQAGQQLHPIAVNYFFQAIDRMQQANIAIAVFLPPVYRNLDEVSTVSGKPISAPLQNIINELNQRGITVLSNTMPIALTYRDFSDRGHLNHAGAEKFSRRLGASIQTTWPTVVSTQ